MVNEDGSSLPTTVEIVIDQEKNSVRIKEVDGVWDLGNKSDSIDQSSCTIFDAANWKCTDDHMVTRSIISEHIWEARGDDLTHRQRIIDNSKPTEVDVTRYSKD